RLVESASGVGQLVLFTRDRPRLEFPDDPKLLVPRVAVDGDQGDDVLSLGEQRAAGLLSSDRRALHRGCDPVPVAYRHQLALDRHAAHVFTPLAAVCRTSLVIVIVI